MGCLDCLSCFRPKEPACTTPTSQTPLYRETCADRDSGTGVSISGERTYGTIPRSDGKRARAVSHPVTLDDQQSLNYQVCAAFMGSQQGQIKRRSPSSPFFSLMSGESPTGSNTITAGQVRVLESKSSETEKVLALEIELPTFSQGEPNVSGNLTLYFGDAKEKEITAQGNLRFNIPDPDGKLRAIDQTFLMDIGELGLKDPKPQIKFRVMNHKSAADAVYLVFSKSVPALPEIKSNSEKARELLKTWTSRSNYVALSRKNGSSRSAKAAVEADKRDSALPSSTDSSPLSKRSSKVVETDPMGNEYS